MSESGEAPSSPPTGAPEHARHAPASFLQLGMIGVFIIGALLAIYFFIGVPTIYREQQLAIHVPHYYDHPAQSIGTIRVSAFYFVPQNRVSTALLNWREILEENLQKLQAFHRVQFQGLSVLEYTIYPKPVIGLQDSISYDTDNTAHGNPEALRRVAKEIEERMVNPSGDLYHPDFSPHENRAYQVILIMYKGVGAAGSENVAFVSQSFLAEAAYRAYGASIMGHEFYHTLGIPDGYELETARPTSEDIMGSGRLLPIEKTYIQREMLKHLGL